MIKAAITPGIQPSKVRMATNRMEPQPSSKTANGGKMIANITLKRLICFVLLNNGCNDLEVSGV